jgi:Fe(3+) dicitrate transport protein
MRDEAGQGEGPDVHFTDRQTIIDLTGSYNITKNGQVYMHVNNLFDEADIVSYQPFGACPGSPGQVSVGYEYQF